MSKLHAMENNQYSKPIFSGFEFFSMITTRNREYGVVNGGYTLYFPCERKV